VPASLLTLSEQTEGYSQNLNTDHEIRYY